MLGLMLLLIIIKCFCTAAGELICSRKIKKGDELAILEKLIDFQAKGHRRFKKRKRSISEKPLLYKRYKGTKIE